MAAKLETAKDISEHLLNRTGAAMMSGDFETFAKYFAFPQELYTFEGSQVINTRSDLREIFDRVRSYYHREQVSDMVRHCVSAEFRDAETVAAVHESRLLKGDHLVQDPYSVLSVIKLINEEWVIVRTEYAIDDVPALVAALGGDLPEHHP